MTSSQRSKDNEPPQQPTPTQQALQESQERLQSIFRIAPTGIGLVKHRILQEVNPRVCEITGYQESELIGTDARILYPSDVEYEYVGTEKYRQIRLHGTGSVETKWKRKDGAILDVLLSSTPLDAMDHGKGITFTVLDITARVSAERALRASEDRYRQTVSMISDVIWSCEFSEQGTLANTFISPVVERLLGVPPETIGNSFEKYFDYVHPDDVQAVKNVLFGAIATPGTDLAAEYRLILPDGSIRWVRSRGMAHRRDGNPIVAVGSTTDITERRASEAQLRQRESFLSSVIETLPGLVWLKDREGRFQLVNSAFARACGIDHPDLLVGKTDTDFWPQDSAKKYQRDDLTVMSERRSMVFEEAIPVLGKDRWFETFKAPVLDSANSVFGTSGYAHDITERKSAEAERERLREQLSHAQKMESVGRLAGGIAHDFNNMLGAILGNTELALEQVDPDSVLASDLQEIRKAAKHSAELTRQLLAFARKQTIDPRRLDLNQTIDSSLKLLRRLLGEDIELEWNPQRIPQVLMDPSQVDQILSNLCVNSRDAIDGVGKIVIETALSHVEHARPDAPPGPYVVLTVSDTGTGMNPETLERLFEPFFTTKGLGKGTGLGMATVYGIVKQNGGHIAVQSKIGHGTRVQICIPALVDPLSPSKDPADASTPTGGTEAILLVEDEPAVLKLTKRMLERLGYSVIAASSAQEAITHAESSAQAIHLLITDIVMPKMSGPDLAMRLLARQPSMRCLFMSGYTDSLLAQQARSMQSACFLQKPFTRNELAIRVREALDQTCRQ